MIELNRAVAHGYAYGPAAGLALLAAARAGGALDGYPLADRRARPTSPPASATGDRAAALFREAAALRPPRPNAARCWTAPTRCRSCETVEAPTTDGCGHQADAIVRFLRDEGDFDE